MAKINFTQLSVAGGIGVVDELLERNDVKASRTGTKSYSFMYRVAAVAIGLGLQQFMPKYAAMGETAAVAATPLFLKSIATMYMPVAGRGQLAAGRQRSFPQYSPVSRGVGARVPEYDRLRL